MTVFAWILIVILGLDVVIRFGILYVSKDDKELKRNLRELWGDVPFLTFLIVFLMRY